MNADGMRIHQATGDHGATPRRYDRGTDTLQLLVDHLPPACFPGDREDLLEAGVREHAPTAFLHALRALPPGKIWVDAAAVVDEINRGPHITCDTPVAQPDSSTRISAQRRAGQGRIR